MRPFGLKQFPISHNSRPHHKCCLFLHFLPPYIGRVCVCVWQTTVTKPKTSSSNDSVTTNANDTQHQHQQEHQQKPQAQPSSTREKPSRDGACRVCLKSLKIGEFCKICAECHHKVCEDCTGYSKLDENDDVVNIVQYKQYFFFHRSSYFDEFERVYHSTIITNLFPKFMYLRLCQWRNRGYVVYAGEKCLHEYAYRKILKIHYLTYLLWMPFSDDIQMSSLALANSYPPVMEA